MVKAAGLSCDIFPGANEPILKAPIVADDIHGATGLDGTDLLPDLDPNYLDTCGVGTCRGVSQMAATISKHWETRKEMVTLVATGPLTNVALLLKTYPTCVHAIKEIVFMGGALASGNHTPVAEFNIFVDPEAAQICMQSGVPLVMVPLDVTHKAIVTVDIILSIRHQLTPCSRFAQLLVDLLLFFEHTYRDVFGFLQGPPLHDPCTLAYIIRPELFKGRFMRVDVVTGDGPASGQTICDIYGRSPLPPNCFVTTDIDAEGFFEIMLDAWKRADEASILNVRK
ncbi:hypothetical protein BZG36_05473 [Bifiguratus adelaidae]|uniref:Inosine/uridine-preferring nucleoside hydrolase domain-containing protein n=1 Tax=Bifiguratus adelaidae TaxID=1938954 RepID=A0A261XSW2_9FUNG|nr:hypothetical protein BZG36_05473 [Bifiguratus adelaidae]